MGIPHFVYLFISLWTFGLFSFLAIMTNAVRTFVYKFLWGHIFNSLGYIPKNTIAKTCSKLSLTFWETAKLFSRSVHHFTISPTVGESFDFSTSSPVLTGLSGFIFPTVMDVKRYITVVFIHIFLMVMWIFSCADWPFVYLLRECLCTAFDHFLNLVVYAFTVDF